MKTLKYTTLAVLLSLSVYSMAGDLKKADGSPEPSTASEMTTDLRKLAPEVPAEATFDESVTSDGYTADFLKSIKPSVPEEATFEDVK